MRYMQDAIRLGKYDMQDVIRLGKYATNPS